VAFLTTTGSKILGVQSSEMSKRFLKGMSHQESFSKLVWRGHSMGEKKEGEANGTWRESPVHCGVITNQ